MVLDMGTEIELFSASTADPLPGDVTPDRLRTRLDPGR